MNITDPLTISYLKGDITFSDYANYIENQTLKNELFNENVIEYTSPSTSVQQPTTSRALQQHETQSQDGNDLVDKSKQMSLTNLCDYLDTDDEINEEIWQDFDVGTLNFDKFIDTRESSGVDGDDPSNRITAQPKGMAKKRKKDAKSEDEAEIKTKRRRNKVLPIEMQGLMGEANLAFARGETNKAIDICTEVIKHAPKASEPFQLLSLLYSEIGDNDKALRVGLIAAQLNKDPDEWIGLIHQSMMEGNEEILLFCYNNAIQCNPQNIDLHIERIRILQERKDAKRLTLAKMMLLKYIDINKSLDVYTQYFNELFTELDDDSDKYKKIYILKNDMKKFKEDFPIERLTCLIQLLIDQKSYKESIMIMMNQCHITTTGYLNTPAPLNFFKLNEIEFEIPYNCDPHIRALLIVCLISLDYNKEETLMAPLLNKESEKYGEYYLLIADKYYEKHLYKNSKKFFQLTLNKLKESNIQIWIKYGFCCKYLNEIGESISAFQNAVKLDDSNTEAAIALIELLLKQRRFYEALSIINTTLAHEKSKTLSEPVISLILHKCHLLYELNRTNEFIENTKSFFFSYIPKLLDSDIVNNLLRAESRAQRVLVFHQLLEDNDFTIPYNYAKLPTSIQNQAYDVFHKLCNILIKQKRYNELMTYSVAGTVLPFIYDRTDWLKATNFTCLLACILKHDGKNGFNILREFIIENTDSNKLWSYVCIIIGLYPSLNQQKFFIRLNAKNMDHLALCLINAHFAIMSGTYRYALVEYMNCFKQNPSDPFINLIISITYCHISCQKYNTKRHLLVSQSLVFLRRYMQYRGLCQESYYNVARVMHQLSLFDLAARFYKKCLTCECPVNDEKDIYDLKRYAAYNLILIYRGIGSHALARRVMKDYLTI